MSNGVCFNYHFLHGSKIGDGVLGQAAALVSPTQLQNSPHFLKLIFSNYFYQKCIKLFLQKLTLLSYELTNSLSAYIKQKSNPITCVKILYFVDKTMFLFVCMFFLFDRKLMLDFLFSESRKVELQF